MNQTADLVANLENLLVTEFHTCQSLHNLTKEEREVLVRNDVTSLARLVERKRRSWMSSGTSMTSAAWWCRR